MASLEDLLNQALGQQIMSPEQLQARIDAQVAAAMPAMLRQYGNTQQSLLENMYARGLGSGMVPSDLGANGGQAQPNGLGLSTYLAQQLAPLQAQQSEAAARIRQQAFADAQSAQNTALGNAAGFLNAEKNRQTHVAINSANNRGAAQRQKQQQLIGGLTGAGAGVGKVGLGMLTAKPGDAGSGSTILSNLKGLIPGLGGGNLPPNAIEAAPGAAGEAGPPPSFDTSANTAGGATPGFDFGGSSNDFSSYYGDTPGLNLDSFDPSTFSSFYGSLPGVDNSSLWNLMDFGQGA